MKSSDFVDQLLNVHGNPDRFSYAAHFRTGLRRLSDLSGCLQLSVNFPEASHGCPV